MSRRPLRASAVASSSAWARDPTSGFSHTTCSRRRGRRRLGEVEGGRRAEVDDVDVGPRQHLVEVGERHRPGVAGGGALGAAGIEVADRHDPVPGRELLVRPQVRLADVEADHRHPERLHRRPHVHAGNLEAGCDTGPPGRVDGWGLARVAPYAGSRGATIRGTAGGAHGGGGTGRRARRPAVHADGAALGHRPGPRLRRHPPRGAVRRPHRLRRHRPPVRDAGGRGRAR
jgi:hypothetical protein